jgi:glycosyltransferase involved in cell wall biosynthesis
MNLVRAWHAVMPAGWECLICGPDEAGHTAEVRSEIQRLGLVDQVKLRPAVSGNEKWNLYRTAELFVLPSHSENFGIVVAEALASGLPVITTKGTPWEILNRFQCGWWIDDSVAAIENALQNACSLPSETLAQMGARGREYAQENLSWEQKAAQMKSLYERILSENLE